MPTLVLLRHGQSVWNQENRFTGWTDVDLTATGLEEAVRAGRSLRAAGYEFDLAYTSVLTRAIRTLWLVLEELEAMWLPVKRTWRLNERHYGALQGLNKAETAERLGQAQVHQWRRSYDVAPPPLRLDDPRHPRHERRYHNVYPAELPRTESLQDTERRLLPYWNKTIAPVLRVDRRPLLVAHGNSLRALVRFLEDIPPDVVPDLNIPTGIPLVYEFDASLRPLRRFYLEAPS